MPSSSWLIGIELPILAYCRAGLKPAPAVPEVLPDGGHLNL